MNTFIEFPFPGGCTIQKFVNHVQAPKFDGGFEGAGTGTPGQRSTDEVGLTTFKPYHFTKLLDRASTDLQRASVLGTIIPKVVIKVCNNDQNMTIRKRVTIERVRVRNFDHGTGDDSYTEDIELTYGLVRLEVLDEQEQVVSSFAYDIDKRDEA